MLLLFLIGVISTTVIADKNGKENILPEQIHLAYGARNNEIVVIWSTFQDTISNVKYGTGKLDNEVIVHNNTLFVDGGKEKRKQWIHKVILKDLKYNTKYVYQVGSEHGVSKIFNFTTPPDGEDFVVRAVIYGDMGVETALSLTDLNEEVRNGHYHFILHTGDFAYDMHDHDGRTGDQFMNEIQDMATHVPYMVCPGNHESKYNFSHYKNRFSMPGDSQSMFYSWDIGPIHFVSVNTEAYFKDEEDLPVDKAVLQRQYNWLVKDLTIANDPKKRQKHPWIIMYGHRPMLCSNNYSNDYCNVAGYEFPNRVGIPKLGGLGLEPLLKEFGVDLVFWAHMHNYERMWPVYNKTVYNGSLEHPYTNPGAPVHITSGAAGCKEGTQNFFDTVFPWSAVRNRDYGYTKFYAYNHSHIHIVQMSTHGPTDFPYGFHAPRQIDEFWLIKDSHKPYDI